MTELLFHPRCGRKLPEPPDLKPRRRWQRGLNKPQAITGDDPFGPEGETPWQQIAIGPGIAGWDDQSHVSQAVRDSLKAAAGIQVPCCALSSRSWRVHLRARAAQLVAVPVLWRVELAWLFGAAIAVVFGILVVRLAQLDIGFVRSATELAVLEVQGDYPRHRI